MEGSDHLVDFEASLIGRKCVVHRREYDWNFDLADGFRVAVAVPWRIVAEGRIAFAASDDGQWFGRKAPVDGEAEAHELLRERSITRAVVNRQTADLTLHFDQATRIDVFNSSMAYEGWNAAYAIEGKRWSVIALGGGEVAFFG